MRPNAESCAHWEWHYRTLSRLRDALLRARSDPAAVLRSSTAFAFTVDDGLTREDPFETQPEESDVLEIEAALERIRNGTYGVCEVTGLRIPAARLRAMPWTRVSSDAFALSTTDLGSSGAGH